MNKSENGFSALYVLLVLIVVGIIGGTSFYVYTAQNNTNKLLSESSEDDSSPAIRKDTSTASKDVSELPVDNPAVVFIPDGLFSAAERADLQVKLISPIENQYKGKVASIKVEVYSSQKYLTETNTDTKYIVDIIMKDNAYSGALYGSKKNGNEPWQPIDGE